MFSKSSLFTVISTLIVIIFIIVFYSYFLISGSWTEFKSSITTAQDLGNSFGVISAVFSGLAFWGLLVAILIQRTELRVLKKQISHQSQETTFFNLLRHYIEIVSVMELEFNDGAIKKGRNCFNYFYSMLDVQINNTEFDEAWKNFSDLNSHYFQFITQLLIFIDSIENDTKILFKNIFISQLSRQELRILKHYSSLATDKKLSELSKKLDIF